MRKSAKVLTVVLNAAAGAQASAVSANAADEDILSIGVDSNANPPARRHGLT